MKPRTRREFLAVAGATAAVAASSRPDEGGAPLPHRGALGVFFATHVDSHMA